MYKNSSSIHHLPHMRTSLIENQTKMRLILTEILNSTLVLLCVVVYSHAAGHNDHAEFYKKCEEGKTKAICSGVPENCVASRNCKLAALIYDDESYFSTSFIKPEKGPISLPYVMIIAFAPFEKSGNYLAAACKPYLTLGDFRIVIYKLQPSEIESGIGKTIETSGGVGKEDSWTRSCRKIYEAANNDYGLKGVRNVDHLVLNHEYVFLRYNIYPEFKNPLYGELPGFKNSSQYSTQDGITYSNVPDDERNILLFI